MVFFIYVLFYRSSLAFYVIYVLGHWFVSLVLS